MRALLKVSNFIHLFLIITSLLMYGAGMGMMDGWMRMMYHKKHHHHHEKDYGSDKQVSLNFKPITIPLPLPIPIPTFVKEKPAEKVKYKHIPVHVKHVPVMKHFPMVKHVPVAHPVPVHVPVPVPVTKHIPVPVPTPVHVKEIIKVKGDKAWKSDAKDMFWNMMMLKMVTGGGSKGGKGSTCCNNNGNGQKHIEISMKKADGGDKKAHAASSTKCCPTVMQAGWPMPAVHMPMQSGWAMPMQSGWTMPMQSGWDMKAAMMKAKMKAMTMKAAMMKAKMMKAMMMKAKMKAAKGCAMMPMPVAMDCPMKAGWWPDEEEEEEEEPEEYYEEEPMMGWDTEEVPFTRLPRDQRRGQGRRGDTRSQTRTGLLNRRRRPRSIFRKGENLLDYDFDLDFDFDYY